MGNASARYIAAICAIALGSGSSEAQQAPFVAPGLKPEQVVANITTRCAMLGRTIEQSSPNMVLCVRPGGLGLQLLLGTRFGAPPVIRDRFIINQGTDETTVFVSSTIDTMNAFGGSQSQPLALRKQDIEQITKIVRGELPGLPFKAPAKSEAKDDAQPEPDPQGDNRQANPQV